MSYKSKRTVTNMVFGIVLLAVYAVYAIRKGAAPLESWASAMLVFLGSTIVVLIVVQVLFHFVLAAAIAAEDGGADPHRPDRELSASMVEDEMDRMIGLRAGRVGYVCVGIGLLGLLTTLAVGGSVVIALHVLLSAFALGALASGAVSIHGYERGIGNG